MVPPPGPLRIALLAGTLPPGQDPEDSLTLPPEADRNRRSLFGRQMNRLHDLLQGTPVPCQGHS